MGRHLGHSLATALLIPLALLASATCAGEANRAYEGNFRQADGRMLGVDRFITDRGEQVLLLTDYTSGTVRRLVATSNSEFIAVQGLAAAAPKGMRVRFVNNEDRSVRGIEFTPEHGTREFAESIALVSQDVSFQGADARLAGTLLHPAGGGRRPAIILLHGSGPLTRHSFGPYPHFFTSLGFAVLIYDKRGAGASTGTRLDASTATVMRPSPYPDDLANDALAAMSLLKQHPAVDPRRIGFWGSSEGGMLATQVAARAKDVAFAINSSGFMEPLWQTLRYQVRPNLRKAGATEAAIKRQEDLVDLWLQVARTGQGWEEFQQRRQQVTAVDGDWFFHTRGTYTSPAQMHRDWESVLSFDPLPRLGNVSCPILAVFGELDTSTPAARTAENMRRVLADSGHRDFTIKVFPRASHSLMEQPENQRMAPGVFDTLRRWLLERMN